MSRGRSDYAEWAKYCYSEDFDKYLSPLTKRLTNNKCILCQAPAEITHHAFYTQGGSDDKPGYNLFPVCSKCHGICHSKPTNWVIEDPNDPIYGRYNKLTFVKVLRDKWTECVSDTGEARESEAEFFRKRGNKIKLVISSRPAYRPYYTACEKCFFTFCLVSVVLLGIAIFLL